MRSTSKAPRILIASVTVLVSATATTLVMASPAAAAITGRIVVSASTTTNLDAVKQVTAVCPGDMVALGGGASITGGNGVVHLTASVPTPVSDGHTAKAVAYPGYRNGEWVEAGAWRLTARVICAYGVTGRQVVYSSDTIGAYEMEGSLSVSCPAGKSVIGMGGAVGGQFILSTVYAWGPLSGVTVRWGRPDLMGALYTGFLEAWAVCVNPVAGLELVSNSSAENSDSSKAVLVTCPSGKKLYDVGGGVTYSSPRRHVSVNSFSPGTTNGLVWTNEIVSGTTDNWAMLAQGICAP